MDSLIAAAEKKLAKLDEKRLSIIQRIKRLKDEEIKQSKPSSITPPNAVKQNLTNKSSEAEKIALFRSLFKGRKDVFPKRFESKKTGNSGYQPYCKNEWKPGICTKLKIKCAKCNNRDLMPVTDAVIRNHLMGYDPEDFRRQDFTIGVYPLLKNETCWFLAIDFDKDKWREDIQAFRATCESFAIPSVTERSRSGNGGHIWIFFSKPISAKVARNLGTFLISQTMAHYPGLEFRSYDRLFPSQDTLTKDGFGNLIALPLQNKPRKNGNSVFINLDFVPFPDQWAFLSSVQKMSLSKIEKIINDANKESGIIDIKSAILDENDLSPWKASPSRKIQKLLIQGPLPEKIELIFGNQIFIEKKALPMNLIKKIVRIAAFQNPAFYKAQAMRQSTYGKPRVISCCDDFPMHIAIPRGCLEEVLELFESLKIRTVITDERQAGRRLLLQFNGTLRPEQEEAVQALMGHDTGVLSASTAFGKTVIGIYLIAKRNVNTMILVHRKRILEQWIDKLCRFTDIDHHEIGQIGGGKRKPTGIIDICMTQSLRKKEMVDDIVGEYGHLIVDECHHIPAPSFEAVIKQSKANFVTGLTATVIRKDGHLPLIFMNCGPVRFKVSDKKQAKLRQFEHKVIVRDTDFSLPDHISESSSIKIQDIYTALISNEKRNYLIAEDVLRSLAQKRSPVLLTERTAHLDILCDILRPHVKNLFMLKGGMKKKEIDEINAGIETLSDNEERLIVATGRYLGEGFDDSRLDTLFLALPISWKGTLNQYAGRLHRDHERKKEVIIYDYVDLYVNMLVRMYKKRKKGYRGIGYKIDESNY